MKCPHCDKDLMIDGRARANVQLYGETAIVATECCGKGILLSRITTLAASVYEGSAREDDWGTDFKGHDDVA